VGTRTPVHAPPPVAVLVGANAPKVPGQRRARSPLALIGRERLAQRRTLVAGLGSDIQRARELEYSVPRPPEQPEGCSGRYPNRDCRDDAPAGWHDDKVSGNLPRKQQRRASDRSRSATH